MNVWILYSGYGNIGDEAVFQGTLRVLRDLHLADRIRVLDIYSKLPKKFNSVGSEYVSLDDLLGPRSLRTLKYTSSISRLLFPGYSFEAHFKKLVSEDCYGTKEVQDMMGIMDGNH